jgi:hypothetical protein
MPGWQSIAVASESALVRSTSTAVHSRAPSASQLAAPSAKSTLLTQVSLVAELNPVANHGR